MGTDIQKPIHLLYAPTLFCNMSCSYCYLGDETDKVGDKGRAVGTLRHAIEKLTERGYFPYTISFHGGEVTTLDPEILGELFHLTQAYYRDHSDTIESMGFQIPPLHIKTNLYNFDQLYTLLDHYKVSISGSVDLPLRLHEKYRRSKGGGSTLKRTIANLRLLATYPHKKKISCVVTREHLDSIDEFIADIKMLHFELGLDMSRFNVMFSFDSHKNKEKFTTPIEGTQMLTPQEQVEFYHKVKGAFEGTKLEDAMRVEWFKEFTPQFCCSASNCGNKFFLLQSDGEVFSCPRGQGSRDYRYGNLFEDDIETIILNGFKQIEYNENTMGIADECTECEYFGYCHLGCPFVRSQTLLPKSYTCLLQKELYRDDPKRYPPMSEERRKRALSEYLYHNKHTKLSKLEPHRYRQSTLTDEIYTSQNSLHTIIQSDAILQAIYFHENFWLEVDGKHYALESQILKTTHPTLLLTQSSKVTLWISKATLTIATPSEDEAINTLHIILLRDTPIVYGDEGRTKQEHILDFSLYKGALESRGEYYCYDIGKVLHIHPHLFIDGVKNNIFFTTKAMREYHYKKQQKNAFYHIHAINLPFSNIEFHYIKG